MNLDYRRKERNNRTYNSLALLRTSFRQWKNFYLHQKDDWRLIIKAEVHYNFQLQLKTLKKWQLFLLERRKKKLQQKICEVFYERKIKFIYFLRLRIHVKRRLYRRKIEQILVIQLIFNYSQFEALTYSHILVNLRINHLAINYDVWKWRTYHLKSYFTKLLNYVNHRIIKKNYKLRVRLFLESKYDVEELRPYFQNWLKFTNYNLAKRKKIDVACKFYTEKILRLSFQVLVKYKSYVQSKKERIILAVETYEHKIMKYSMLKWIKYTNSRLQKMNKITAANSYYKQKLKRTIFTKILDYAKYKQHHKEMLNFAEERYLGKLIRFYFGIFKKHWKHRQMKKTKLEMAKRHFNNHLKRYSFQNIQNYCHRKRRKQIKQRFICSTLEGRKNIRTLRFCFDMWKSFVVESQKSKELEHRAEIFYPAILSQRIFAKWQNYVQAKKYSRERNEKITKRLTLIRWKNYTRREVEYRNKLEIAKDIHKKRLSSKGLVFLLKAGYEKQLHRKRIALNLFEKDFQLEVKYFYIWKKKVLGNIGRNQFNVQSYWEEEHFKKNVDQGVFKWNRACFQKPKIPENLSSFFF